MRKANCFFKVQDIAFIVGLIESVLSEVESNQEALLRVFYWTNSRQPKIPAISLLITVKQLKTLGVCFFIRNH